jgi:hypothetical protein
MGVDSDARSLHGIYQRTLLTRKCERRRNADIAIPLSTPWAFHILCLLITQTLEKHCVNGNRKVWRAACNQMELKRRNDNGKSRD